MSADQLLCHCVTFAVSARGLVWRQHLWEHVQARVQQKHKELKGNMTNRNVIKSRVDSQILALRLGKHPLMDLYVCPDKNTLSYSAAGWEREREFSSPSAVIKSVWADCCVLVNLLLDHAACSLSLLVETYSNTKLVANPVLKSNSFNGNKNQNCHSCKLTERLCRACVT